MTRAPRHAGPAAACAIALASAAPAVANPSEEITFSATAPGASTAVHPRIDYESTDSSGQQRPLLRHTFTFPPGTRFDSAAAGNCQASAQELRSQGLGACPADSRVGGGLLRAIATRPPLSAAGPLDTDITIFNSSHPKDAPAVADALIAVVSVGGQVQTSFVVPLVGNVGTEEPPPTCEKPDEAPPCPSGEITVRSVDYTIDEHSRTVAGRVHRLITTPPACPGSGRWMFNSRMQYRDGTVALAGSPTPCDVSPRIALRVAPGTAPRCRLTRFSFTASGAGHPLAGALVRFANRRATTDSAGRASITARLCSQHPHPANVRAAGFRKGVASVAVAG
ncbi:MAG: hypothetical protein QOE06_2668 [Thermoleophilaceae bacterium]|nr:hypothetical protein [Thermoleophilaceae bacterium]